jgi:hypothetical protein
VLWCEFGGQGREDIYIRCHGRPVGQVVGPIGWPHPGPTRGVLPPLSFMFKGQIKIYSIDRVFHLVDEGVE